MDTVRVNLVLTWELHYGESDPLRKLTFNDHYPSALHGVLMGLLEFLPD